MTSAAFCTQPLPRESSLGVSKIANITQFANHIQGEIPCKTKVMYSEGTVPFACEQRLNCLHFVIFFTIVRLYDLVQVMQEVSAFRVIM
jgi:hypothetical protein